MREVRAFTKRELDLEYDLLENSIDFCWVKKYFVITVYKLFVIIL